MLSAPNLLETETLCRVCQRKAGDNCDNSKERTGLFALNLWVFLSCRFASIPEKENE
jgi:hypothetical protein